MAKTKEIKAKAQEAPKVKEVPKVREQKAKVLVIDLGASLKKGDALTDEQLTDLIGAGFTEEQLFGK
jgi:hypothetical protein